MDFFQLLEKRRSIRDYEDKPVPLDLIKEIINDSIKAPNAGNMQLWRFIIVNNKELIKRISDSNKKGLLADIEANPNSPFKSYESMFRKDGFNIFHNAPSLIYIIGTAKMQTISQDCAILATYFMLSATARGLGTCWVAQGGEIKDPDILTELAIPDNYKIVAPIILGYPKKIPPMPARKEPKLLKVIS
ncbi:nitroreductase family protein [Thermodesulfobacteriota bacterium]